MIKFIYYLDDEKNKMLPEAESINKDGSQDGLMEAANIPLQSKEEDQMWKILKTDERYYLYLRYNWYGIMIFATFSSIPFMCNWISKNNSRHKYRKWKMEFSSSLTMDLKLNENRALLPKLKVILIWSPVTNWVPVPQRALWTSQVRRQAQSSDTGVN